MPHIDRLWIQIWEVRQTVFQQHAWPRHVHIGNGEQEICRDQKAGFATSKERQIVLAIAEEKSARIKVIAEKLYMSEHTLRNHLTAIYDKLQVTGRMELYLYAVSHMQSGELV